MFRLSVTGRHVDATKAPLDELMQELGVQSPGGWAGVEANPLEEEIFAQDGQVEDIIAVDRTT